MYIIYNNKEIDIFDSDLVWRMQLIIGSRGIAPTRNCTHFVKIEFVVAWGGFYFIPIISTKRINRIKKGNF